jgi:hypothetical protein
MGDFNMNNEEVYADSHKKPKQIPEIFFQIIDSFFYLFFKGVLYGQKIHFRMLFGSF